MPYVYTHTRLDKNEIFYIGIGSNDNFERAYSKNRNSIWKKIVNKTEYSIQILQENLSWEEACKKESELISLYGRIDLKTGILANLTDGGEGTPGRIRPLDEVEKFSGSKNGSYGKCWITNHEENLFIKKELLDEYLENGWKRGRYVSEEIKSKIRGKRNPLTADHKEKIRKRSTGHIKTAEERKRRSASLKNRTPWHNVPGFKKMTPEEKIALKDARGPRSCNVLKISGLDLNTFES